MEDLFYRLSMASIDACFHLVARLKGVVPDTYKACFIDLVTSGLISQELADKLKELSGLRNVIAHAYWGVDHAQLYGFIHELPELKKFRDIVVQMVK